MVTRVRLIIVVLLALLAFEVSASEKKDPIDLVIEKNKLKYGKALTLTLSLDKKVTTALSKLLNPINTNFNYAIINSTEDKDRTRYKIKLQPRRTGTLILPSLNWKEFKTRPTPVYVTAALSRNNQPITLIFNKLNTTPWVREQTQILITIQTTDKNIILNSKNIAQKGSESYFIPQSIKTINKNSRLLYEHTIGWNVFFSYAQRIDLNLPAIEYIKDGVPGYKFYLPRQNIKIKKLPVYISPVIPVGKIELSAKYIALPKTLLRPGMTPIIQYSLIGHGIPAKWLPSLSQKYNTVQFPDIQFSHATTSLETKTLDNDLIGKKIVDLAFTPLSSGLLAIKDIQLPYFEPETGLLKYLKYKHSKPIVLNGFLQVIFLLIGIYLVYYLLLRITALSKRFIHKFKYHRLFKDALAKATTYEQIKSALKYYAASEYWPVNLSINQWLDRLSVQYIISDDLNILCRELNQGLYSIKPKRAADAIPLIRENILISLSRMKKKPRRIRDCFNLAYLS
ncbi:hypothetical protein JYT31_00190 [Beggiatoa alba]|nr:hypothetical protein [Beggiatoa alba]